ncbi:DNA-binding transcriptional MerR regulator [Diaminobutyricimonas aerilata]|uniref:DNA-binding transcriptional MerR regulator n=1 Tax=Diaminobutyricimonas aerilata TaxID=1162967 RepID=A0A2M9CLQ3_9MICO|nr:MerR family transcriptional regulator [Diaminobutyricimonas aerilata]PJJ72820.1 DNA-binding transcriptional MerR regulator [Diaminobutyricimonas aerilata]
MRRTVDLARAVGYSVQQIRDLERLGVIPPARREANGYRSYSRVHEVAARAYRGLAAAVGPVEARRLLASIWSMSVADAAAAVGAAHVRLERERDDVRHALRALAVIRAERADLDGADDAAMTIAELADALGVRASTLRHWEAEGLVVPERVTSLGARRYRPSDVREARIVAALRASGYGVPAVREVMAGLRGFGITADVEAVLQRRLGSIAARSVALLRTGSDLAEVLDALRDGDAAGVRAE